MKTVFIDCSPKKRLSASGFISDMTSIFVSGTKKRMKLRTKADYENILKDINEPLPYFRGMVSELGYNIKTVEYKQTNRRYGRSSTGRTLEHTPLLP